METYKTETNWVQDYVLPALKFHFHEAAENYRRNCEETVRALERMAQRAVFISEMDEAGVYKSLHKLRFYNTETDVIWHDLHKAMENAEAKRNQKSQNLPDRIKSAEIYTIPPTDNHRPRRPGRAAA